MTKITPGMIAPPSITQPDSVEPASKEQVEQLAESVKDLHRKFDALVKRIDDTFRTGP